ncbi:MAG: hypothetical protein NC299_17780 [Lachnospiraceae bacterium]|nr:hypothetical protein [Ruminococcus sp.]MCM1277178.1 hypothetical protein [Lachnospiraceae bacterium]
MEKINQIWCEEDGIYYPETKTENGRTYKLDPKTFVYLEQLDLGLTDEEQALMSEDIGQYGEKWRQQGCCRSRNRVAATTSATKGGRRQYMRENHPEVIPSLEGRLLWELIPRQVDKEAWEYRELLRKQYAVKHPRPTTFTEIAAWENTLEMMIDRAIMENVVLVYRE